MMNIIKKLFIFSVAGLLSFVQLSSAENHVKSTGIITGKVIGISDGDTITILNDKQEQIKIRLIGIDCPEKTQAFGNRAKITLSNKVFSQNVKVETRDKDKYGRTLGIVKVGDEDINEYMISQGLAWHFKKYANTQPLEEANRYAKAQELASQNKRGLWIQDSPMPPWEFRDEQKKSQKK
jgi:endonuclease YncB( thermonuclease family)